MRERRAISIDDVHEIAETNGRDLVEIGSTFARLVDRMGKAGTCADVAVCAKGALPNTRCCCAREIAEMNGHELVEIEATFCEWDRTGKAGTQGALPNTRWCMRARICVLRRCAA